MLMQTEQKIDAIYEMCIGFKERHAAADVHQEQVRKELDVHREELNDLNEHKNKLVGKIAMVSLFVGGVITLLGAWLSKKFL